MRMTSVWASATHLLMALHYRPGAFCRPAIITWWFGESTDGNTDTPYVLDVWAPDYSPTLPLSESSADNIRGRSDIDIYPFSLAAETSVLVTLTGLADVAAGDIGFSVYGENGSLLRIGAQTSVGVALSDSGVLPAGNYYVVVGESTDGNTDTPYVLNVWEPDYSPTLPLSESSADNIRGRSDIGHLPVFFGGGDKRARDPDGPGGWRGWRHRFFGLR